MTNDLKPCPFCGCAIKLTEHDERDEFFGWRTFYRPEGQHKGHGGYCPGESVRGSASVEAALKRWNARAALEQE